MNNRPRTKLSFDFVKNEFESRGYLLLEDEYKNNKTKMHYKCIVHPDLQLSITYKELKRGRGCKYCGYENSSKKQRTPFIEVKEHFESRGYILFESEYINSSTKMKYQCKKHSEKRLSITFSELKQGNGCPYCGREKATDKLRHSITYVRSVFSDKNYYLLEDYYTNSHKKMRYRCNIHTDKELSIRFSDLLYGVGCPYCWYDKLSQTRKGSNHPNWNQLLTEEDRLFKRLIPGYKEWRRQVFLRDDYTCLKCERKGGVLNAHHKDGYDHNISKRTDVSNGATLCYTCHLEFHKYHGFGNNTFEQYEEWISNKAGNYLKNDDRGNDQKGVG